MKTLKLKQGGLLLPRTTSNTETSHIQSLPIPRLVQVLLLGEDSLIGKPCVKIGDFVTEGDIIAKVGNFCFHASISGIIKKIDSLENKELFRIGKIPFIEIHFQGQLINWKEQFFDYQTFSRESLIQKMKEKGVIHCGDNPYLSFSKIIEIENAEQLIIYCLDEGSYISCHQKLLAQEQKFLNPAIQIMKKILNPKKTTVVMDEFLEPFINEMEDEMIKIKNSYPHFHENLILKTVLQYSYENNDRLQRDKIVLLDLLTLYNVYNAVIHDKPVIDKIVTIDGQLIQNPGNYVVKVGTLLKDVFADLGVFQEPFQVISGHPLRKNVMTSLETPIRKEMMSFLLLSQEEEVIRPLKNCIQCGACEKYCPKGLIPNEILMQGAPLEMLKECILCGLCSYICPSGIPLLDQFKESLHNQEGVLK